MPRVIVGILFFLLHALGAVFICAGLFLYEDEEGKFQNKVEEWWVRLSDTQSVSRSKVAAFMQGVARLTADGFDTLFGRHLFSLRLIPVSIYLSLASLFLLMFLFFRRVANPGAATRYEAFLIFLSFVALALVPALLKNKWLLAIWWAIIPVNLLSMTGFVAFLVKTRGTRATIRGIGLVALLFLVSLLCDLTYIVLTRYILRRVSRIDHPPEIVIMILVNLAALAIPLFVPIYGALALVNYAPYAAAMVMFSLMFNAIDFLVGFAGLLLALLLLLHRLFWPTIQRPLYAIYRFAPIKRKRWLFATGLALLFLPTHTTGQLLRTILEKL